MKIISSFRKNHFSILVLVAVAIGIFFRLYNLNWGAPFYFHPDERNIASSISQLSYSRQMNPHFFAYGSLPIYTIYFIGVFVNFLNNLFFHLNLDITKVDFVSAILTGRIISAIFSLLLLLLIYKIGKIIKDLKTANIAVILASFSVGFIQYAHFATFEMWLTFFTSLLLYATLKYILTKKIFFFLLSGILLGFLISVKVSSLIFVPFCILIFAIVDIYEIKKNKRFNFFNIEKIVLKIFILLAISAVVVFATSPFYWVDCSSFISSIKYESSVALGALPVFYTQGFKNSIPIIYQLKKVYPFILNPFTTLIFILTLPFIFIYIFKRKNILALTVILFFAISFFSQAFLFVKWVRYYIPTLPFIYVLLGFAFSKILEIHKKIQKKAILGILYILILVSFIFSLSFFITVLKNPDTRIDASKWAKKNIPKESVILSESYDLGIIPFNQSFKNITLFNFYDLDTDPLEKAELEELIKTTDYIILPSQRIFKDRISNPKLYPEGNIFYKNLFNGKLGFKKVYETSCNIFCKILYLENPIGEFEETANVFDRPTIIIFKNEN